jgi:hypothetical protein
MCGKEQDFDPDALVQNAVYALCGPYTVIKNNEQPESDLELYSTFEVKNIVEDLDYCNDLIDNILNDASKLIIGFISTHACNKDNQLRSIINSTYNQETLNKFEPVFYEFFISNLSTGAVDKAVKIIFEKQYTNNKLTFRIMVSVFKLNNNIVSAMLSGNIESNFFVSKLNYKKEIK